MDTKTKIQVSEEEVWKEIPESDKKYFVSNLGRVKSLYRNSKIAGNKLYREKILNQNISSNGSVFYNLIINKKGIKAYLHHLLVTLFLKNPLDGKMIVHKNLNNSDNSLDNLEWKYKGVIIKIICKQCNNEFPKNKYEHKALNKKEKDRSFFCCRGCYRKWRSENNELILFRYVCTDIRNRANKRNMEFNLTPEYLKTQWEKQNGICPYTNLKMELVPKGKRIPKPDRASLDRIDSSRGYIQGNVEFICASINYAKNAFSKKDIIDFIKRIVESSKI